MAETNPINQVFLALWDLLESSTEFAALVPEMNRIKYIGGSRDPLKHRASPADFPMVCIKPTGGIGQSHDTNTHGTLAKTFTIKCCTGDKRTDKYLFDLEWAVFRALHDWNATMEALTWDDEQFVKACEIMQHEDTLKEKELSRDETGWATIWQGQVLMAFDQSKLTPERGT